jgi:hypothetical protein
MAGAGVHSVRYEPGAGKRTGLHKQFILVVVFHAVQVIRHAAAQLEPGVVPVDKKLSLLSAIVLMNTIDQRASLLSKYDRDTTCMLPIR